MLRHIRAQLKRLSVSAIKCKGIFCDGNGVLYRRKADRLDHLLDYLQRVGHKRPTAQELRDIKERSSSAKQAAGIGYVSRDEYYRVLLRALDVSNSILSTTQVELLANSLSETSA